MADSSFIDKLRMSNIFPSDGSVNTGTPFGMPDLSRGSQDFTPLLNTILNEKEKDRQLQLSLARMRQQGQLSNIGKQMGTPWQVNDGTPPNVVYKAPLSDQFATNIIMGPSAKDKQLQTQLAIAQGKQGISEQDINIKQQRANVYAFKAQNPGLKPIFPKGGTVQFYNPATGEIQDTGIDTGTLSEQDKMDLQSEERMGEIAARGKQAEDLQKTRGEQNLATIAARVAGQKSVAATKPTKEELPTQTRVKQSNAARQLANTRPDLAKFITMDDKGNPTITPTGGTDFFGNPTGPTKQQFDEINNAIYGSATPESKTPSKPTADELIKKYGG